MKYKSVLPLFVLVTLSGCSLSIPLKFKEYIYIDEPLETFKSEKEDIYYQEDKVNTLDINVPSGINIKTGITSFTTVSDATLAYDNTNKILKSSNIENINGVQTQKLLVVPIYFTDSSVADSEQLKEDKNNTNQILKFYPSLALYNSDGGIIIAGLENKAKLGILSSTFGSYQNGKLILLKWDGSALQKYEEAPLGGYTVDLLQGSLGDYKDVLIVPFITGAGKTTVVLYPAK